MTIVDCPSCIPPIMRFKGVLFFRLSDGPHHEHKPLEVICSQTFLALEVHPAFYPFPGGKNDATDLLDVVGERVWLKRDEPATQAFLGGLSFPVLAY